MPRHALRAFFERVVVAALPLAACACGGHGARPPAAMDMAAPMEASDLAVADDLSSDYNPVVPPVDTCEAGHPPHVVTVDPALLVDGGTAPECRSDGECLTICPPTYTICCGPYPADAGSSTMTCTFSCGPTGRRPAGIAPATSSGECGIGQYLASMAHLEAASVHAFRVLARQLSRHGAPARLVARARAAARDEVRHARLTRRLAARHGATAPAVSVRDAGELPSLETLARDNAVEGCVRETFGALLAAWQARAAGDDEIRAAMADIAEDEAAHAELAWDLDAWIMQLLDGAARARVRAARAAAVAALAEELSTPLPPLLVERAGLPDAGPAQQLFAATRRQLWS